MVAGCQNVQAVLTVAEEFLHNINMRQRAQAALFSKHVLHRI